MTIQTAGQLRSLHQDGLLVIANAWDGGSARLVESLGAKAIATTSAGVAWAHGYADGSALPMPLLLETVRDIARVVRVPVSVDMEDGYARDPAVVGRGDGERVDRVGLELGVRLGVRPGDRRRAVVERVGDLGDAHGLAVGRDQVQRVGRDGVIARPAAHAVGEAVAHVDRVVARVGSTVYDGSIRTQLKKMRDQLVAQG